MSRTSKIRPEEATAIAARLKLLRATSGLSQEKFAESVGLTYSQWSNFEAGKRIGIDAAMTLVREMRVTLDWIYLGETVMMPAGLLDQIKKQMRLQGDAKSA